MGDTAGITAAGPMIDGTAIAAGAVVATEGGTSAVGGTLGPHIRAEWRRIPVICAQEATR